MFAFGATRCGKFLVATYSSSNTCCFRRAVRLLLLSP